MRLRRRRRKKSDDRATEKTTNTKNMNSLLNRIISNPNLSYQIVVIMITLLSDNMPLDGKIQNMATSIDKFRNVVDVLNNTVGAIKTASDAPRQIRGIIK